LCKEKEVLIFKLVNDYFLFKEFILCLKKNYNSAYKQM